MSKLIRRGTANQLLVLLTLMLAACAGHPAPTPSEPPVAAHQPESAVSVGVDERAELLAIMFRLAGNPEYSRGRLQPYVANIDAHFGAHRDHPAILMARSLRETRGVGFDAVMQFAIHLSDATSLAPRVDLDDSSTALRRRWRQADLAAFYEQLRRFAADADAASFFARHRALYDSAGLRLQRVIDEHADLDWYPRFYGTRADADYLVVPLLVNADGNFGPRFDSDGTRELYAILGVGTADSGGFPVFTGELVSTLIHEFNHSYVNALVERHLPELTAPGERVFALVEPQMRALAYGSAPIMLWESVVRAAVVRYVREHDGEAAAANEVADQQAIGFVWMNELEQLLGEYETNRSRYPTLESFMPRVVDYYRDLAPRIDSVIASYEVRRPMLVASSIPADSVVAATDTVLEFRFDRPMRSGYSIGVVTGRRSDFLDITADPSWDETRTVLRIPVRLEPGRSYAFLLNRGPGIRSVEGVPARSRAIEFRTR